MTIQEQITEMKAKQIEMINQRTQLNLNLKKITQAISKLETLEENEDNPNLADDLIGEFS